MLKLEAPVAIASNFDANGVSSVLDPDTVAGAGTIWISMAGAGTAAGAGVPGTSVAGSALGADASSTASLAGGGPVSSGCLSDSPTASAPEPGGSNSTTGAPDSGAASSADSITGCSGAGSPPGLPCPADDSAPVAVAPVAFFLLFHEKKHALLKHLDPDSTT